VRDGSCAVGADAGGVNGRACGEAEGCGQLEGEAAFEFGGTEHGVLGAAFESDEGASVEMAALGDEIQVRASAPGSDAPIQGGALVGAFPGRADSRIGTGHKVDVLFLWIANSASDEIEKVSLPKIGPAVEREQADGGGAKAIGADGGEHVCAGGIPAIDDTGTVALLFACPIEFWARTGEAVENCAVAGGHFFENAANEPVAWRRRNVQVGRWLWDCEGGLVGVVNRGG